MRCCHRVSCRGTHLDKTAASVHTWLFLLIFSVFRFAAAAVSPVASGQADGRRSPADRLEMIPSSQGSPVISPPKLVPAQLVDSQKQSQPEGNVAVATPASGVKRATCWVLNVSLELRIYSNKDWSGWKRVHLKKLNRLLFILQVCSLLFRALSSHTDGQTFPVLARCSDEEESEEDYGPSTALM